jgi:prepilin-type N-terminal cleavage/methylation domain-containing protein
MMGVFARKHCEDGFTLTELLVAMVISGILLGAIVSTFITQRKAHAVQEQVTEMTLNVRAALDMVIHEVRMAGYGVPTSGLASWIDWVRDAQGDPLVLTGPVTLTKGGAKPDTLTIAGCFDPPIASAHANIGAGSRSLQVRYHTPTNKLNTVTKKIAYIGRHEYVVVTTSPDNRARVNTITIDTDPTQAGDQGLTGPYPAHTTPIELLKVITYSIVIDEKSRATPVPILKRHEHTGGHAQPLAENIEDLRLTQDGKTLIIAMTGRTAKPDPTYTHPTKGDGYRRLTVAARVHLRNVHP